LIAAAEGVLGFATGTLTGVLPPLVDLGAAACCSALTSKTGATNCGWGRASLSCTYSRGV